MKVLAILGGLRADKTTMVLPYTGLEYRLLSEPTGYRINKGSSLPLAAVKAIGARLRPKRDMMGAVGEFRPDVIYTNIGMAKKVDVKEIERLKIPVVVRVGGYVQTEERNDLARGGLFGIVPRFLYGRSYRKYRWIVGMAKHIVVISDDMVIELAEYGHRSVDDISVVPLPCDIQRFDLPKTHNNGKILVVSTMNFKAKVQALADFAPALDGCDATIIAPGRYQRDLAASVGREVMGYTHNIEAAYQEASLFCYFSYLDSGPNVVLEAWASHTPVIANRCAWSKSLIRHGETGILVDNVAEAKAAINSLLSDPRTCHRLAHNAYEYVKAYHSPQAVGIKLRQALEAAAWVDQRQSYLPPAVGRAFEKITKREVKSEKV